MCIISYIVNRKIFGRNVHHEDKKISPSLNQLMGPDFLGYLRDRDQHRPILEALPFERMTILSDDGLHLAGYYYDNPAHTGKTALLIHGHSSNGFEGYASVGLKYIHHGFNVMLIDNRACGNSEGKWCTFGIQERKDTLQWVNGLAKKKPQDAIVIHGTSLGGAVACMVSEMALPPQVKAIVSDCAFADIRRQLEYIIRVTMHVPYPCILPSVLLWFYLETGLSVDTCSPLKAVRKARVPMLFIHGEEDRYVKKENALQLYEACGNEKQLLLIAGAGHAASHYIGKEKYEGPLFQFLEKYLKEGKE